MRFAFCLAALFLVFANVPAAVMQTDTTTPSPIVVPATEIFDLTSETNGHDYRLWIGLPENYATSEESYPVLYLLDPGISFLSVTEALRFLAWGEAYPKVIVVGIGYPTNFDEMRMLRERDYYLKPDDFLKFIAEELIPLIDSTYRTDPADRAIAGWSYGSDFAFYSLVSSPELFDRYLAIDGNFSDVAPYLSSFGELLDGREVKLFIAAVGDEFLSRAIQTLEIKGLEVTGLSLGDAGHGEALYLSLVPGLRAIYKD